MIDTRVRYWEDGTWKLRHPQEDELRKRDAITVTLEISVSTASTTFASSTTTPTSSATSSETAAPSPLPTFFDGALSSNFTEASCPIFINDMIAAEAFQACYPISLLLQVRNILESNTQTHIRVFWTPILTPHPQGSTSFFDAESSLVSISRVLDHACAANVTSCASYLASVASNLTESRNCGADYAAGNPTVVEAHTGLIAYQVVYSATCLRDTDATSGSDGSYCFGNAVTNTTNASQTYFYFLPLNASLPGATLPICEQCLRDTMSIYHVATANRRQPIANVYGQAARMVDTLCGTGFANATLADEVTTSSVGRGRPPSSLVMVGTAVVVGVVSWLV